MFLKYIKMFLYVKEIVFRCFLLYIFILISCSYLLPILDLYDALQLAILCMVID